MIVSFIKKSKLAGFILFLLIGLGSSPCFGQVSIVQGVVQDDSANPLTEVKIIFHDVERGTQFETSTNKKGEFMKVGLPFSNYVVRFELEGYIPYETKITVRPGRRERLAIIMRKIPQKIDQDKDFTEGINLFQEGRYQEAAELFLKVVQKFPDHVEAFYNLGVTYIRLDRIEQAIESLEKAVQINPDAVEPYITLGECYLIQEQTGKAVSAFDRALSLSSDNPETFFRLGVLYYKADKIEEALECFENVIELDPKFSEAFYQAGLASIKKGEVEKAVEYFESFLKLEPDSSESEQVRAMIKELKKDQKNTKSYFFSLPIYFSFFLASSTSLKLGSASFQSSRNLS